MILRKNVHFLPRKWWIFPDTYAAGGRVGTNVRLGRARGVSIVVGGRYRQVP